ncbi:carbonic anhydrase [Novosphingobium bradum]|uniref:carbonic anhydrase n=1 Tax=Novosphingobium bradum TaxID=1737444 RepID=A0ABV7ITM8_9SPHN
MKTRAALAALCATVALIALAGAGLGAPHRPVRAGQPERYGQSHGAGDAAPVGHGGPHWTYDGAAGPEHWGEMSEDFAACAKGHMQSPVDLGGAESAGRLAVRAAYRPGGLTVLNNGHTVQVNFPEGSQLASGIARYKLVQMHFHTPSEETVYGIPYPMVVHFVHVDANGNLAVLAVLFEEGAHNPELDKVIRAAPRWEQGPTPVAGVTFDPARLLPDNLAVWRYEGSLTTPPCTEGVRWHVAEHRVTASAGQIAAIHAIIGDNARPTQPLHGRLLVAGSD